MALPHIALGRSDRPHRPSGRPAPRPRRWLPVGRTVVEGRPRVIPGTPKGPLAGPLSQHSARGRDQTSVGPPMTAGSGTGHDISGIASPTSSGLTTSFSASRRTRRYTGRPVPAGIR